jgi:hypothetical protein
MYYATGDTDLNTGATEVTYHVKVATGAPEGHGLSLVTLLVLLRPHSGCAVLRKFQHFLMKAQWLVEQDQAEPPDIFRCSQCFAGSRGVKTYPDLSSNMTQTCLMGAMGFEGTQK